MNFLPQAAEPAFPDGTPETNLLIVFPTNYPIPGHLSPGPVHIQTNPPWAPEGLQDILHCPFFRLPGLRAAQVSFDIWSHFRCQLRFFVAKSVLQNTKKCPGNSGFAAVLDLTA